MQRRMPATNMRLCTLCAIVLRVGLVEHSPPLQTPHLELRTPPKGDLGKVGKSSTIQQPSQMTKCLVNVQTILLPQTFRGYRYRRPRLHLNPSFIARSLMICRSVFPAQALPRGGRPTIDLGYFALRMRGDYDTICRVSWSCLCDCQSPKT